MSQNKNFLDELGKLAESAFSSAVHAKDSIVEYVESFLQSKNVVLREEFETLKETVMLLKTKVDAMQNTHNKEDNQKIIQCEEESIVSKNDNQSESFCKSTKINSDKINSEVNKTKSCRKQKK